MIPLTQHFSKWNIGFELSDAPSSVQGAARNAILDTIGVMSAGGAHTMVRKFANNLSVTDGPCSAVCVNNTNAETAALLNGMAAHIWDFDDTSYTGIMHGSAVILPTVLAMAEECGASENELLAAYITGSEITYTLADICGHDHYFKGWWSTATFGIVGATAAAARLLGLNPEQMAYAIGMAAASSGGGKVVFGSDFKAYLAGDTARRAIGIARAAKAGLTGPVDAFEDYRGFFALLNDGSSNLTEAHSLGQRWRLSEPGLLLKTSPVCSAAHAAIDQLSQLVTEASVEADDIVSINAEIPRLVDVSLIYPRPETVAQAQFSLPYALACAALHGRVRLTDLDETEILSTPKLALMNKINSEVADDLSTDEMRSKFPESARISMTLTDGRVFNGFCGEAYGMPGRPLSDEDRMGKFHKCLEFAGTTISNCSVKKNSLQHLAEMVLRDGQNTITKQ